MPCKLLIDSRLSAFSFFDSNKTAPKVYENAPICTGAGQNKFTMNPSHDVAAKVGIFFDITKGQINL